MRQVLADNRGRIERTVIETSHRIFQIEVTFRLEYNRTLVEFVGITFGDEGHQNVVLSTLLRHVTGAFDALTAHDQEINRYTTQLTHFHESRQDIHLLKDLMYEITILNTVFGDQSTFGGPLMGPFEDLLRRDVILRQSPGQSLGSFQVALDTKPVFETFHHLKLTTFLVQVTRVIDDFKMDKTTFFDPLQVLAPDTTRVVGLMIFIPFDGIAQKIT